MKCRFCAAPLTYTFLDLGAAPPSNSYLTMEDLNRPEKYYPLRIKVCDKCWLVQTEDYADAQEFFSADYAYFSSTSTSWLEHAALYAQKITNMLSLSENSFVIEIASNDGYLLRNFTAANIPCLGIEPTLSTAAEAQRIGIPVLREFFCEELGSELSAEGKHADLLICNNVYAHVPDINDFTRGLKAALKPGGTITIEFPHLMRMLELNQFDTVYHEHFSYLSITTVCQIFEHAGLRVWHSEELSTHGGSLRLFGCHADDPRDSTPELERLTAEEARRGLRALNTYTDFQDRADRVKNNFLEFLIRQKKSGKSVLAYGAAAKGNTLLNYAGVKPDLLPYVFDAATAKQGKFMPGSHIPILAPSELSHQNPDFIVILPWNIAEEVQSQLSESRRSGTRFVTAIPELTIL